MDLNKCLLGGRLVRDPELRFGTTGKAMGNFTIAINRKWQSESGEKKEDVAYLDCKVFGKTAETIVQYFRKGKQILVEARATTEAWEDKQTREKRSAIRFVVEHFHFVGDKDSGETNPAPRPATSRPTAAPANQPQADFYDQDVPF